jgi:hypothetical protein
MEKSAQDALAKAEETTLRAMMSEVSFSDKESVALQHEGVTKAQGKIEQLAALVGWQDPRVKKITGELDVLFSRRDERLKSELPDLSAGAALPELSTMRVKLSSFVAPDILKVTFENKGSQKLWASGDVSMQGAFCTLNNGSAEVPAGETRDIEVKLDASCAASWQKSGVRPRLFRASAGQEGGESWIGLFWLP